VPRLFVAVYPIPFKEEIVELQKKLSCFIVGKVVEVENLHLTLSFLGDVEEKAVEEIKKKLEEIASFFTPFEIAFDGIKLIPTPRFIRVIGLETTSKSLWNLAKTVEKTVGGDVKPPHLTLFRVKKVKDRASLLRLVESIKFSRSMIVEDIKLMKSTLTRKGPIYEAVASFPLLHKL